METSMRRTLGLVALSAPQLGSQEVTGQPSQRLFLYANELYRVPSTYRQVRLRHGIAHISHQGKDFIVRPGEALRLERGKDIALVSPLHSESLVLELFQ